MHRQYAKRTPRPQRVNSCTKTISCYAKICLNSPQLSANFTTPNLFIHLSSSNSKKRNTFLIHGSFSGFAIVMNLCCGVHLPALYMNKADILRSALEGDRLRDFAVRLFSSLHLSCDSFHEISMQAPLQSFVFSSPCSRCVSE
jgi:hypothetical protein